MPITTIDPNTALVVIDLQKGIIGYPTIHPVATIIANAAKLAHAFRKRTAPVVLVNVVAASPGRADIKRPAWNPPAGFADFVPELDQQASDLVVTKYSVGAFYGTSLDMFLRRRGVTQIVMCGISTSNGVESTARGAHDHGYNLTIITDAVTDTSAEQHANALERVFPKISETGTTAELLAHLA